MALRLTSAVMRPQRSLRSVLLAASLVACDQRETDTWQSTECDTLVGRSPFTPWAASPGL